MIEDIKRNNKKNLTVDDVIKMEQYYGVSHKAMLYRLINDKHLKSEQIKDMEVGIIDAAAKLGFDISLYCPSPEGKKRIVFGSYIASSEKLLEKLYPCKIVIPKEVYNDISKILGHANCSTTMNIYAHSFEEQK